MSVTASEGAESPARTGIAIVGCGFVAGLYLTTLDNHPDLELIGVYDILTERAEAAGARHGVVVYEKLSDLVADDRVDVVVNLTNPESHAEVTLAALDAGRHVYTEKPMATTVEDGRRITEEAERRGLVVACAPANFLGEAFQTLWREVRAGSIGTPRLVYAQLDDGIIHLMGCETWRNHLGVAWPYREEFAVGCTIEHAGYHLVPLTAMFGAVRKVVSDQATLMPDKFPPGESGPVGPDFMTASLTFEDGVVARLTCSIVAPHDRSLTVIGDAGVLRLTNCWDFGSPVTLRTVKAGDAAYLVDDHEVPPVRPYVRTDGTEADHDMDFARGIAEMAAAVQEGRTSRLSTRHALHVLEVTLALAESAGTTGITSEFDRPEPLSWAN
ncbi:Gfo/Idh/MocA family protein [Actinacidiphila yeochonensis]|uniref:Gfo/Idh/MocA family protein n=1 Tax=Actinacidiphila yeochonensis TaxID=89050 RepID=UPI00068D34DB|nr:Gfo/Idh/MocA family oxidoreductase [Actinacidiphila yeochonensis]